MQKEIIKDLIINDLSTIIYHWDLDKRAKTESRILAESVYDYIEEFIRINNEINKEKTNTTFTGYPNWENNII